MATAVVTDVEAQFRQTSSELGRLKNDLETEQGALASVTGQYNSACRDVASGKNADPEKFRGEMTRRSARIQGFEDLISTKTAEFETLAEQYRESRLSQVRQAEQVRLSELIAQEVSLADGVMKAKKSLDEAHRAHDSALSAVGGFRRKIEQTEKRRASGQE